MATMPGPQNENNFRYLTLRCLAFLVQAQLQRVGLPGYNKTALAKLGEDLMRELETAGIVK